MCRRSMVSPAAIPLLPFTDKECGDAMDLVNCGSVLPETLGFLSQGVVFVPRGFLEWTISSGSQLPLPIQCYIRGLR